MPFEWEVSCGDPGNTIVHYFSTTSEVLEFCGRLLYGNIEFLFEIVRLDIRRAEPGEARDLWEADGPDTHNWTLRARHPDGTVSTRVLQTKHEVFGMLIADLMRGATDVQVYNLTSE